MACKVKITSAAFTSNYNNIAVAGTATGCTQVSVSVIGGGNCTAVIMAQPTPNNAWAATLPACDCGVPVQVQANCDGVTNCAAAPFILMRPCQGDDTCCPETTITFVESGCNSSGQQQVDFTITTITPADETCTYTYTLDFGDGNISPPTVANSWSSSNTVVTTISHFYNATTAQTYTAVLNYGEPNNCQPIQFSVPVTACTPNCPPINFNYVPGACNPNGTRNVTISATFTAASPINISGIMTATCWTPAVTGSVYGTSLTLTQNLVLPAGSCTVTASFNGCPQQTYTFTVPDCCPTVNFDVEVCGDPLCSGIGTRPVTINATVTPQPGVQTTATLIDSDTGNTLDSGSGSTPFTLTATLIEYGPGTHQVAVSFTSPANCPDQTYTFCVPDCEKSGCYWLHSTIITFGSIGYFLLGLAIVALLFCPTLASITNTSVYIWVMAISLGVFVLALIFWWLAGCASNCILDVILWQIYLMVAVLFLYLLVTCFWPNLFMVIIFALLFYYYYKYWLKNCCVGKCDTLYYLYMAIDWVVTVGYAIVILTGVAVLLSLAPWYWVLVSAIIALVIGIAHNILGNMNSNCIINCGH